MIFRPAFRLLTGPLSLLCLRQLRTWRFKVLQQAGERIWLVTFMHYDLGYFEDETCRLEAITNPFGPKVRSRAVVAGRRNQSRS